MSGDDLQILGGLVVYLIVLVLIGVGTSRRVHNLDDFLLGGRRLGPWVTAISERASGESAWFLMGLPGAAYAVGFREFWAVIGIACGILLSWVFIALPLRRASMRLGALTLPDYFAARYPGLAKPLRSVSAVAIVFFYVSYLGAQIIGAGKLFKNLLGWESTLAGALLGAGVVAGYTLLGGFLAVAWTDLLQGLMMAVVAVLLPLLAIEQIGLVGIAEGLAAHRPASFFAMGNFALDQAARGLGFGAIVGGLAWGLGYLGQPHLLTRYMAIGKPRDLRLATRIAMGWVLLAYWGVALVGILAVAVVGPEMADPDLVVAHMARALLPGWLAGLVIAGILAAIMSTADSQLLVATSSVVQDLAIQLRGMTLSPRQTVAWSRVTTVVLTGIAMIPLLTTEGEHVIDAIVAYAWTGLGATFGPPLLFALWWPRTRGAGVLAGMVTGMVATVAWKQIPALQALLDLKIAAFLLCGVAVLVGSLVAEARSRAP